MTHPTFQDRLYDHERAEWDQIVAFLEEQGEVKLEGSDHRFKGFKSLAENRIDKTHLVWAFRSDEVFFHIYCIDYTYIEREDSGDGVVGYIPRLRQHINTTFWMVAREMPLIPSCVVEPTSLAKRVTELGTKGKLKIFSRFDRRYSVESDNPDKTNRFMTKEVKNLFLDHYPVWVESSRKTLLVRDRKPIHFESFKNKFELTRSLILAAKK